MRTPSPQQGTILSYVMDSDASLLVQAAAGSGKTTTLEMIIQVIKAKSPVYSVLYVVFNTGIAQEAKHKFGKKYGSVDILTTHALGKRDCHRNSDLSITVDQHKLTKLMNRYVHDKQQHKDLRSVITYTLAADVCIELSDSLEQMKNVAAFYGVVPADPNLFMHARQIIHDSREMRHIISYDDMIDQPLNVGMRPTQQYDFILVDEAQDLNNQQMRFISRYAHNSTRYVFCGDKFQSIYGFRGANFNAMDTARAYFNLYELPLSVCYRCGIDIIELARTITTTIDAAPAAIQGRVEYRESRNAIETLVESKNGDMVVCRTNAPLVRVALALLRVGKRPHFLGRDFSEGLIQMVKRFCDTDSWKEFHVSFAEWVKKKHSEYFELERVQDMELLQDKVEAISVLCEDIDSPKKLVHKIQTILVEAAYGGITLATIHKAKGLEAGRVIFLDYKNVPHPMAQKAANREQALQQETNLKYVAITRAKHTLIMQDWEKSA